MKNELKFKIARIIIIVLLFALIFVIVFNHFDKVLTAEKIDEGIPLLIQFIIFILFYAVVHYVSIILHEIGHLIFGLKSKLEFMAFNIKGISIIKKKNKITVEKASITKDIGGYCNMRFSDSIKYTDKDVVLYFYGGIIFNIILLLLFFVILLVCRNEYIKFLSLLLIIYNSYLAIYNSIPYCNLVGVCTDMRHIVNYLHDPEYIKKMKIVENIMKYRENNNSIKGIDKNFLYMPKNFKNDYDMTIALVYIAYLSEIGDYKKMGESIDYVLSNTRNTITESQRNALKVQQIDCIVHTKFEKKKLIEIWDNSFDKYIKQMSVLSIGGLAFKYLYYKVISIDENQANNILMQFKSKKEKYSDKQEIQETEKFIHDIDRYLVRRNK